jgi:adenine/guanine phosphoribosyltransferase-like PRPP-binding protein
MGELCRRMGVEVKGFLFLLEIKGLKGRQKLESQFPDALISSVVCA